MAKETLKDPVRELYLEKCTPEQHLNILENEIKMNEEKVRFYTKNPFHVNGLKQKSMIDRHNVDIQNKYREIEKIQRKIQSQIIK